MLINVNVNKFSDLKACIYIKKRLQHRLFLVNIAKFLSAFILRETCERLLLKFIDSKWR